MTRIRISGILGNPAFRARSVYIATILLSSAYFSWLFLFIPVNSEARDYIYYWGFLDNIRFWSSLFFPNGENTRAISMAGFSLSRAACGLSAPCINAVQIFLLLAALTAGALHLHQLLRRPALVSAATLLWALSLPAFSAGFWQATQHDKLAFLFALSALALGLWAIRRGGAWVLVPTNLLIAVLFVLAINSKEIAFFLPVAAAAQVLFLAPGHGLRRKLRAAWVYALPTAYSVYYVVGYMDHLKDSWRGHVFDGDIWFNISFYFGSLTGRHAWSVAAVVAVAVLLVASFFAMIRAARSAPDTALLSDRRDPPIAGVMAYLLMIFLASIALVVKAQYPDDFYLLISDWAFLGWLMTAVVIAQRSGLAIRLPTIVALAALCLVFFQEQVNDFGRSGVRGRLIREAHQLYAGYQLIHRYCMQPTVERLDLIFAEPLLGRSYFFRGGREGLDQLLGPYICGVDRTPEVSGSFDGSAQPDRPGQLAVVWSRDLVVQTISDGGRLLYQASDPGRFGD